MPPAPLPEPIDGRALARPVADQSAVRDALSEIDAEIADHLASAAADFVERGGAPEKAEAAARSRFGDIASIRRNCWWIQEGDRTMLRWLAIALMSVLIVVMIVMGVGGWRVQTALANRLDALTGELSLVQQGQQQLLDRQATETPEISGLAYLDEASQPAAGIELQIFNASEMKLFRRLRTDATGGFHSHSLPAGDYFVLAPLLAGTGQEAFATMPGDRGVVHRLQSQPLYVYPGTQIDGLALDLRLHFGQLSFEVAAPAGASSPAADEAPRLRYEWQFILAPADAVHALPVDPNTAAVEASWPLRGRQEYGPWDEKSRSGRVNLGGSVDEPLRSYRVLLPGSYRVSMSAVMRIADDDLKGNDEFKANWRGTQMQQVNIFPSWPLPADPIYYTTINVAEGKRTHLRFPIPETMAATLRDLFAKKSEDLKEIADALKPSIMTVEVIGDQELLPATDDKARYRGSERRAAP